VILQTLFWNRLSTQLILSFFVLTTVPLMLVGYLAYDNGRQAIKQNVFNHLISTNLLKVGEFERWIRNNELDLEFLVQRPLVRIDAEILSTCQPEEQTCQETVSRLLASHLQPALADKTGLSDLSLLRIDDGLILLCSVSALVRQK
jgi:hypothetical protein